MAINQVHGLEHIDIIKPMDFKTWIDKVGDWIENVEKEIKSMIQQILPIYHWN